MAAAVPRPATARCCWRWTGLPSRRSPVLHVQRHGPAQLAYRQVLEGRADPAVAFIVRMAMADAADTAPPTPAQERAALSLLRPQPGPGKR
jgi:hypothetical protein